MQDCRHVEEHLDARSIRAKLDQVEGLRDDLASLKFGYDWNRFVIGLPSWLLTSLFRVLVLLLLGVILTVVIRINEKLATPATAPAQKTPVSQ